MGNQTLDTYTVLRYPGRQLPMRYVNFVITKWMRSYRRGNDYFKLAEPQSYYAAYYRFLTVLISSPQTVVRVAVLTEDQDVAIGFCVSRGTILDYVHVHKDCRKQGIARAMLPKNIETITHLTKIGLRLWPTRLPEAVFNPFA